MATVLVVDDSAVDRRLASRLVERAGTLSVVTANNGRDALDVLGSQTIDVVLTDLQMPDMDGLALVQQVRLRYPLVPVILMTAHGSEQIAVAALAAGASGYVPKTKLAESLVPNIENVIAMARCDRSDDRLIDCLRQGRWTFRLSADEELIPPLVDHLQHIVMYNRLTDETGRIRLGVALEEALRTAVESAVAYPGERPVEVVAQVNSDEARFEIRSPTAPFASAAACDPSDPSLLEAEGGRAVMLMRTLLDEVQFESAGSAVTLVKRRA
jgi:CheY-like chemotaxis protein